MNNKLILIGNAKADKEAKALEAKRKVFEQIIGDAIVSFLETTKLMEIHMVEGISPEDAMDDKKLYALVVAFVADYSKQLAKSSNEKK